MEDLISRPDTSLVFEIFHFLGKPEKEHLSISPGKSRPPATWNARCTGSKRRRGKGSQSQSGFTALLGESAARHFCCFLITLQENGISCPSCLFHPQTFLLGHLQVPCPFPGFSLQRSQYIRACRHSILGVRNVIMYSSNSMNITQQH